MPSCHGRSCLKHDLERQVVQVTIGLDSVDAIALELSLSDKGEGTRTCVFMQLTRLASRVLTPHETLVVLHLLPQQQLLVPTATKNKTKN